MPRRLGTGTVTISTESAASVRTDRLIASPPPLPRPSTSLGLISQHEAPRASGAFHLPPRNTSHPTPDQDQDHKRNPHLASAHFTPPLLRLSRGPSNAPRTCASTNSGESKNAVERPKEPSIQLGDPTNDGRTPSNLGGLPPHPATATSTGTHATQPAPGTPSTPPSPPPRQPPPPSYKRPD